jgi:hypothetical protein
MPQSRIGPPSNHLVHETIRWEETQHAVWHDLTVLQQRSSDGIYFLIRTSYELKSILP